MVHELDRRVGESLFVDLVIVVVLIDLLLLPPAPFLNLRNRRHIKIINNKLMYPSFPPKLKLLALYPLAQEIICLKVHALAHE